MSNRLAGETSPYLLQHADNPVDWYPWGAAALAAAREQNKPILLSIGYSACHWCHVMAHECFEQPDVAAVMNRLFINVKVDREERPDLDLIYQQAHQMLTRNAGGWPLTAFLSPEGMPFFIGTYFPPTARYGRPGFVELMRKVDEAWHSKREAITQQNQAVLSAFARTLPSGGAHHSEFGPAPLTGARDQLGASFDPHYGGFGAAPKFPHPTDLAFLLRRAVATGDARAQEMVLLTLTRMAEGGIRDHLGGGFCRYSTDERWAIPHFEKMLYDNGPLLALYAEAWALTGEALYREVAEGIVDWALREMRLPGGGFASSLDADSEGEEGRYYVWAAQEVRAALTPEQWAVACAHWGLDAPANFEGRHWHLQAVWPLADVARALKIEPAHAQAQLAAARAALFELRQQRLPPGRDDKLLTSWNALMIAGLVRAAAVFARPDWLAAARAALEFIRTHMWQGERLLATWKDGRAHLDAYLDDHAFLIDALIGLLQMDYRSEDLAFAEELADVLLDRFEDRAAGGFFFTRHDHEALIHRPKPGHDGALPAGNGVAALALQRLGHLTGERRYLDAAERTLQLFYAAASEHPAGYASLLAALEEHLVPPTVIVVRGPQARAWRDHLLVECAPDRLVIAPPEHARDLPPALDKPLVPGAVGSDAVAGQQASLQTLAWVCRGFQCLPPVSERSALDSLLAPGADWRRL